MVGIFATNNPWKKNMVLLMMLLLILMSRMMRSLCFQQVAETIKEVINYSCKGMDISLLSFLPFQWGAFVEEFLKKKGGREQSMCFSLIQTVAQV